MLTGYRLVRRQSVQQALSGLFGVAIAALIAYRTGQARGYFLYGILTSFGYAAAFLVTLVIRRPVVGLVWEFLDPSPQPARPPRLQPVTQSVRSNPSAERLGIAAAACCAPTTWPPPWLRSSFWPAPSCSSRYITATTPAGSRSPGSRWGTR